ncbi:hypothetical protein Lysil_0738 [Lysobacter silvestris]|uniref:Uncharacterized protein n=1 Tax=Solilutibacter silvestris TaxID=1645665 RepID=A0A2K1Q251_9GAMM|nr:hypothetical protein Lysil_0738 [Lysobacter silvestris]
MSKIVVNGLVEKRSEIAGNIKEVEGQLQVMHESLSHLDATIRLLDPNIALSQIKAKRPYRKNAIFGTGEVSRRVREVLRDAGGTPLSTADIALQILIERGLEQDAAARSRTSMRPCPVFFISWNRSTRSARQVATAMRLCGFGFRRTALFDAAGRGVANSHTGRATVLSPSIWSGCHRTGCASPGGGCPRDTPPRWRTSRCSCC